MRQSTLLNLGRHFSLPKLQWPVLCIRLEAPLSGQQEFMAAPVSKEIESLAQRYYSLLVIHKKSPTSWDEATLWHTYTMLTDVEAVFRSKWD